jgi:uncharacterized membrane protein YebE (DUF533 family)
MPDSLIRKLAGVRKLAFMTIPGAVIGGVGGAIDDEDRSEGTGDKFMRGAATGGITGLGADIGAIGGALAGMHLSDDKNKLRGAIIGGGAGAVSLGILAYLLARKKDKYKQTTYLDKPARPLAAGSAADLGLLGAGLAAS